MKMNSVTPTPLIMPNSSGSPVRKNSVEKYETISEILETNNQVLFYISDENRREPTLHKAFSKSLFNSQKYWKDILSKELEFLRNLMMSRVFSVI